MDLLNIMVLLSIKNQALAPQAKTKPVRPNTLGQPSRSGPGPLASQAKHKPVRPRTLGTPSQNQAGPAQDPWPQAKTKPVRPRTLGPPSQFGPAWGRTQVCVCTNANQRIGNTIGNSIGNTIGKI